MRIRRGANRAARRVPPAALLVLALVEAGVVLFLTWPTRSLVICDQLPALSALAICAAVLLVASMQALKAAGPDRRIAGGAAILAGVSLFVAAHYIANWHKPCVEVQKQLHMSH